MNVQNKKEIDFVVFFYKIKFIQVSFKVTTCNKYLDWHNNPSECSRSRMTNLEGNHLKHTVYVPSFV